MRGPVEIETTRFGVIDVDPARIITFPRGFIGFPDWKRFVLLPHREDSPFWFLQSVDEPALALVVMDPREIVPDYVARVPAGQLTDVAIESEEDVERAVVLALVTLRGGPSGATANLKAPLIVNPIRRLGIQVILEGSPYAIRHPIVPTRAATTQAPDRGALVAT